MKTKIYCIGIILIFGCQNNAKYQPRNREALIANSKDTVSLTSYQYATYCNARFAYCVDYPNELLIPQHESENGDGLIFTNKAGKEILRVYGTNMLSPELDSNTIQYQYHKDLNDIYEKNPYDKLIVTYKKMGKDFYVISGYKKGNIYYQKMIEKKGESFANLILQYPIRDSLTFNEIAKTISQSFH